MVTRILSGVVGLVLALAVLLFGGTVGAALALALLSALAVYEALTVADFSWGVRVPVMALAAAAPLLLFADGRAPLLLAGVYLLLVMTLSVVKHEQLPPPRTGLLWLLPCYIAGGFTALTALRMSGEDGLFYVFLSLIIPWMSDTGAYFTGVFFGKHKLCPNISPKKTVEGLIGGIVVSVASAAGAGALYTVLCGHEVVVHWLPLLIVAAIGAPLSVIGDLFASVIKRQFGAKDYGHIMPGHGGIMDRFDSVIPTALLLWMFIQVLPILG